MPLLELRMNVFFEARAAIRSLRRDEILIELSQAASEALMAARHCPMTRDEAEPMQRVLAS